MGNQPRRNKFNARRTQAADGIWFASGKEAGRYAELRTLERAGKISDLVLQPKFTFEVNGFLVRHDGGRPLTYRADFGYVEDGKKKIEDVKGVKTAVYKIKKALMRACHGIEIVEV